MGMKFYERSVVDLSLKTLVTITVTDATATDAGNDSVDYLRDRSNDSGWGTVGSNDAALTQMDIDFGDLQIFTHLFFFLHNWKSYTVQYWNGSTYVDFSTPIAPTTNTEPDSIHEFQAVECSKIRIIINGTMVADEDKFCAQILVCRKIGEFQTIKPWFKDFRLGKNKKVLTVLSGKAIVTRNVGAARASIDKGNVVSDVDLDLIQLLHDYVGGFLVHPGGGSTAEFRNLYAPRGWRKRDIYLMDIASELPAGWDEGRFARGINHSIELVETV